MAVAEPSIAAGVALATKASETGAAAPPVPPPPPPPQPETYNAATGNQAVPRDRAQNMAGSSSPGEAVDCGPVAEAQGKSGDLRNVASGVGRFLGGTSRIAKVPSPRVADGLRCQGVLA
jgi:hypothetical protein